MEQQSIPLKKKKKRLSKGNLFLFIIGILVLLLGVATFIANAYINRSVEQLEGTIELPILQEEVTVITDDNGIPHIYAENERDLFIAQGYVQAQHRLFQMELARRQASGTLSEVVGISAVEQDKYFRTLGLRRAAEASYDIYSEEAREVLGWFSDGVNAFIEDAKEMGRLPIEFRLMGAEPEEWTPIDSLTIGKFMAFDLGGHWERQAFHYYLLDRYGHEEEKAYELFPIYPENGSQIIQDDEIDIAKSFEHAVIPNEFNGSNNWVVSGEKSASGKPLLANDPHLGLATPSIWLQMHLEAEDINVSGVIFAGVPGIILGHNEHIAWGVTNVGPDVQQLYIEKRNPDNRYEFLFEEEWEEAEVVEEPIHVKDGETIDYEVVITRHGPIVSEFAGKSGGHTVLSLKWTALEPTTELEAILEINKASNWEEFEKGLEKFHVPAQNFVFAAKDGTIAYKANGKIPIYENPEDALLPMEGWKKENELNDYIPFAELPKVINPEKGYIATANNKIAGESYPYHLSHIWAQPYRYDRIAEVLESKDQLTLEDMRELQLNKTNLQAREFLPHFLSVLEATGISGKGQEALAVLADWDYIDDAEEAAPLIFHQWLYEIEKILFAEIPESMMHMFTYRGQNLDAILRKGINGEHSVWLEENGGLEHVLKEAFTNTMVKLVEDFGEDVTAWKWGDFHQVAFHHPLSGIHPVLEFFFNRIGPLPMGGSNVTPMAAAFDRDTGIVNHGAPWRYTFDLADPESAYHINGPGQSGHFKSNFYHGKFEDWVDGEYYETRLDEQEGSVLKFVK